MMVLSVLYFWTVVSIIVGLLLVNGDDGVAPRVCSRTLPVSPVVLVSCVCFCRNPENDTSLHLPNSPLSCVNFTFFS